MAQSGSFKDKMKSVGAFIKRIALRFWNYLKAAKMEYIVMLSLFVIDIISKRLVMKYVDYPVVLIPKFLRVNYIMNTDAAFGATWLNDALGDTGSLVAFCLFAFVASAVFIYILVRSKGGNKLFRVCLAMVTAGAMGNCIDRIFLGGVVDFIEIVYFGKTIKIGSYVAESFYIFNLADSYLVVGAILMFIFFLFIYKDKDAEKKKAEKAAAKQAADNSAQAGDASVNENGDAADKTNVDVPAHAPTEEDTGTASSEPETQDEPQDNGTTEIQEEKCEGEHSSDESGGSE